MHLRLRYTGFGRNRRDDHCTFRCGSLLNDTAFTIRLLESQLVLLSVGNCFGGKEKFVGRWQYLFILVVLLTGLWLWLRLRLRLLGGSLSHLLLTGHLLLAVLTVLVRPVWSLLIIPVGARTLVTVLLPLLLPVLLLSL